MLSVIVVNFNGGEFTPGCLESVPAGTETIVVDNGSTDGSPEEIARRFPGVKLIRNRVNRGFAAAVNQGIDQASGEFICLLNNDARLSPGALSTLEAHLREHPEAGMVAPQLLHEDGRRQHSFDAIPSLATVFLNKSLLRLLFPSRYPGKRQDYAEPIDVPSVIGACMMVRRECIESIGKLDEAYFLFLEETDWCLRAARAGWKVRFVPTARVVHLQGLTRAKVAVRARIEYTRSLFTFFRKNRPAAYPIVRLFNPVKNLVEFIFQAFAAPFSSPARERWIETGALVAWQLFLCPRSFGLSRASDPRFVRRGEWLVIEEYVGRLGDLGRLLPTARVVKDLKHKKTVALDLNGTTFLIKTYKADTWLRRLKCAFLGSFAWREWDTCLRARLQGAPVVPLAAVKENSVVCEELKEWSQLQETLLSDALAPGVRRKLLFEYGKFARRLHDTGVWQYDFNPTNVLVRGREFRVIDFEKMKLKSRLGEPSRLRTLAKMNRIPMLSRADRLRFLKGYLHTRPDETARLGEIVAEITTHYRRKIESDSRKAERRCVRENRDFARFEIGDATGWYRKRRERVGLTFEELQKLLTEATFDGAGVSDALERWRKANREARRGEPLPLAVVFRKGDRGGRIIFRKA